MNQELSREQCIAAIDRMVRRLTWHTHKQMLQTLSRPDIGLTMPQTMTLFAIRAAGSCRMSELAEMTQQSAGTLTGIVDRLIEENLVGRIRDIDDRRVVQVMLTPHGEDRLGAVEQVLQDDMADRVMDFNHDELLQFGALLGKMMVSIDEPRIAAAAGI